MTPTPPGSTAETGQPSPPAALTTTPCTIPLPSATTATLVFAGTQFTLTYTGHPNRGQVHVYVDDVNVGTINQYNPSLTWQRTWASPTFANGTHTVKLVHATGSIADIDAIQIIAP